MSWKTCRIIMSLSGQRPGGRTEDFLPYSITSQLHKKIMRESHYVKSKGEQAGVPVLDEIQAIAKYYPDRYLVGTPSTQDIQTTITKDYSRVNAMSLIYVFVAGSRGVLNH